MFWRDHGRKPALTEHWPDAYREAIADVVPAGARLGKVKLVEDSRRRLLVMPDDGRIHAFSPEAPAGQVLFDFNERESVTVEPPAWARSWVEKRPPDEYPIRLKSQFTR